MYKMCECLVHIILLADAIRCLLRGTEKQHVADDYAKRLSIGQYECEGLIADVASNYISRKSGSTPPPFQTCELLNVSICPATEQGSVSGNVAQTSQLLL